MENFLEIFNQYARSELLVLVPVLYIIGKQLAASKVANERVPLITIGLSVILCGAYTFSMVPIINANTLLLALFTSVTQGILFAGTSMLSGVMFNSGCFSSKSGKVTDKNT